MKKMLSIVFIAFSFLFAACSGSDVYQGDWKAMNAKDVKYDLNFGPDSLHIVDASGETTTYEYSQYSVSFENSKKTYGIKLDNGLSYSIIFPESTEKGVMVDDNGYIFFTIGRADYYNYNDIFGLVK